jgi:hypothetical protein
MPLQKLWRMSAERSAYDAEEGDRVFWSTRVITARDP